MIERETLIPAKDAAKFLGISRANLSRLVKRNKIGVYRIGIRTMFDMETLNAFKKSVYVEPNVATARGEVK